MAKTIGIDVYSALHQPRGMGNYTINFIKELAKLDNENKYILYGDIEDANNVLPKQNNFIFKKLDAKGLFHYEQIVLPKQCKKDKIQILHSPANTSPIFLDKNIERFITVHDIIFLKKEIPLPKNKRQLIGRFYYALNVVLNIKKADKIFTVSEFSKNDILKTFKLNPEKIIVTPNGHEHFDISQATNFEELQTKYNLPKQYYFSLGGEAPSKNTEFLLKVFSEHNDINLVVAGIKEPTKSSLAKKYMNYSNIVFVPYITQADLVGLYKNAQAFIFPSLYEGFGIPLLEAMKCECPIICSNSSCLPEIAGDAALYFEPTNVKILKTQIEQISSSSELRTNLTQNGNEKLKLFSWQKMIRNINY